MEPDKNYHYYAISLKSVRGIKITAIVDKAKSAAIAANCLAKELGADGRTESPNTIFPGMGIGSLIFHKTQSSKRYTYIGCSDDGPEYIPNMAEEKGKTVARLIHKLPGITADEYREAFGIPKEADLTPSWFISGEGIYLKCSYELGEEFVEIEEKEFEEKKSKI